MKIFNLITLLCVVISFEACQKSTSKRVLGPTSKNTPILCDSTWTLTGYKIKDGNNAWVNSYFNFPLCLKDDRLDFFPEGIVRINDYNYKCNASDPVLKKEGLWTTSPDETEISMQFTDGSFVSRKITTLTKDNLVLLEVNGTQQIEYSYTPPKNPTAEAIKLSDSVWKLTNYRVKIGAGNWVDSFANYLPCLKDDRLIFTETGVFRLDDYNTKCNAIDPRFKLEGAWNFANNFTRLEFNASNGSNWTRDITLFDQTHLTLVETTTGGQVEYSYQR